MDPSKNQSAVGEMSPPAKLAKLLDVALMGDSKDPWHHKDAAAILRHQLAAPLLPDLLIVPGAEADRLRESVKIGPDTGSFGEQLASPRPSLELLEAIKHFARHVRDDVSSPCEATRRMCSILPRLPRAGALQHAWVTTLSDPDLREGFAWAARQPGAESLQHVLQEAATLIE